MSIQIEKAPLEGILIITPRVFKDSRGYFYETFHQGKYQNCGITKQFVQDNHSHSLKGVLRGLHYQIKHAQAKLICVLQGEIFDVAVDIRQGSPTFGQWYGCIISSENRKQLYIPEGFAHGFCVMSDEADIYYKCTDLYHNEDEGGLLWSDPEIDIQWPIKEPLLSDKDKQHPTLETVDLSKLPVFGKP